MEANLTCCSAPPGASSTSLALGEDSIERLRDLAYQVARRFGFPHADAEDLAQEAMVDLLQRGGEPLVTPGAWVRVVTRRKASAALGQAKREIPLDSVPAVGPADSAGHPRPGQIDLPRALDGLPRRQRDLLLGYYWLGLGLTELSRTVGLSLAYAKVLLHRARGALRIALADYDVEPAIPSCAEPSAHEREVDRRRYSRLRVASTKDQQPKAKSKEQRAKSRDASGRRRLAGPWPGAGGERAA